MLPRHLARWEQLVTPAWLAALIGNLPVVAPPSRDWRVFEIGCGGEASFVQGHIPGAGYIDTGSLERAPLWNKVSDQELLQVLLDHGIRHDTTVVLYGRNSLCAARAAHLLLYAGVRDVRLLDGGLDAWLRAGGPLAQDSPAVQRAVSDFGIPFPGRPDYMTDVDEVSRLARRRKDAVLVSIRTWDEFVGRTSGYTYIDAKGEIPGARWGRAGNDGDVNSMSDFHRADGTMKPAAEIEAFWREAGIHPGQRATFYCGTGWRASLAFFYAWLMNWQRISVYDGGWHEWSRLGNPVAPRPAGRPV